MLSLGVILLFSVFNGYSLCTYHLPDCCAVFCVECQGKKPDSSVRGSALLGHVLL